MVYVDPYWDRFMWHEIETAPQDGTEILAAFAFERFGKPVAYYSIVRWENKKWVAQADGQRAIEAQGDCYTEYVEPFVTHWMAIPGSPTQMGEK